MNTIDKKTAERFLENPQSADLSIYQGMEMDAVHVLKNGDGYLDLSGITQLDAETASALASFKYHHLNLKGLEQLDKESVSALSKFTGGLSLGFRTLDTQMATALSHYSCVQLDLFNLSILNEDAARALSEGTFRLLLGLTQASDSVLRILASGKADVFSLSSEPETDSLKQRFTAIFAQSPKGIALEKQKISEREHIEREVRNWLDCCVHSIKEADKVCRVVTRNRIGLFWAFFGGFRSYGEQNRWIEISTEFYTSTLLNRISGLQYQVTRLSPNIYHSELKQMEAALWKKLIEITTFRAHALQASLERSADREYNFFMRLLGHSAISHIRSSCKNLVEFLSMETITNCFEASRGAIMLALEKSPKAIRDTHQSSLDRIWQETVQKIELPLARAVDRLRTAGATEEVRLFLQTLAVPQN